MGSVCVLFSPRFGKLRQILQLRPFGLDGNVSSARTYILHWAGHFCTHGRGHLSTLQDAHWKIHGRQHPLADLMGPFDTSFLLQMDNARVTHSYPPNSAHQKCIMVSEQRSASATDIWTVARHWSAQTYHSASTPLHHVGGAFVLQPISLPGPVERFQSVELASSREANMQPHLKRFVVHLSAADQVQLTEFHILDIRDINRAVTEARTTCAVERSTQGPVSHP
jgi:hypothetical protein